MAELETQKPAATLGISHEEFEQYQRQFIEERAEKYSLLEKVQKLEQEVTRLSYDKSSEKEKDFDRLLKDKFQKPFQSLLSRAKRESVSDSSSDLIIQQENNALQKRLHSQEDDFQRQNVLLMQELQLLSIQNEELERKLKSPVLQGSGDAAKRGELEAKVRALEAELAAFRSLPGTGAGNDGSGDPVRSISDGDRLAVELAAATEETRTLKELMESSRTTYESNISDQEKTVANLIRDLESKQSSVQHLLHERDQLQRLNKELSSSHAAERERLLSTWQLEKAKLVEEKHELRQAAEEEKLMARTRTEDIERQMKDLLEQMDVTGRQTKRDHDELLNEHKLQIASLLEEVETLRAKSAALELSEAELRKLSSTLQQEATRRAAEEGELSRLAEKRKATIDDLTAHLTSLKGQHEEEMEGIRTIHTASVQALTEQLKKALAEAEKLPAMEEELALLREKIQASDLKQVKLSSQLAQQSAQLEELKLTYSEEASASNQRLQAALNEHLRIQSDLSEKLETAVRERSEVVGKLNATVETLEQQLSDRGEDIKIMERKNAGVARDLQKQLQSEKKHVEKLQNKLNELLRDGSLKLKIPDDSADFTERDETGSVSSWSFVSSKSNSKKPAATDGTSDHSNAETETGLASSMTEQEVRDLVTRITKLQQEKSGLVERVSMLETGNAAMAQDLINKSAVIDRYLQATPVLGHHGQFSSKEAEAFSLRSLIDRVGRDKTMDLEAQKSLRHLLEETLTKNVHLQKNMELLTEELDRLRGSTPPRQ